MENVSGMPSSARKAGMASLKSCHATRATLLIINAPTTTNAGAVIGA